MHGRAMVLAGCLICLCAASALPAAERPLWRDPEATENEWRVRVDPAALMRGPTAADSTFSVVLPDGVRYAAVIERTRIEGAQRFVSTGRLGDDPTGEFLFIVDGDRIAGLFGPKSEQRYCLLPTDTAGGQRLTFSPEGTTPGGRGVRPAGQRPDRQPLRVRAADIPISGAMTPPVIDVLFLYTPRVKLLTGSEQGVRALADLAVQQANQTYFDSGVVQTIRLAHVAEVNYVESGVLATDLEVLTRPADGIMDEAITLRLDYRADLVHLFVAFGDQTELGWLNNFSTFNMTWTFSVSLMGFVPNDGFTRAIGSNQGIEPDWVPLNMAMGAFPAYSFGYSFNGGSGQRWKTIMSNGTGTRIRRHSNPLRLWDGVPYGSPTTAAMPADAVQSLNNTGPTIAAISDGVIVPPPVISSPVTATGKVDQFFQYQITASNGPTSFGAAGLPLGLSVNTQNGLISGAPRQAGTYRIDLSATNAGGTGVKVLTLTVDAASDCPVQRMARRLEIWGMSPRDWLGRTESKTLDLCRRFRDDVLRTTPEGRELIELYYQHRVTVLARLERDPQLLRDAAACLVAITPAVEVGLRHGSLTLSATQHADIHRLLSRFEQDADTELQPALHAARRWLTIHVSH
jgi:hypothetical protein